jgi:hypothetical protein
MEKKTPDDIVAKLRQISVGVGSPKPTDELVAQQELCWRT